MWEGRPITAVCAGERGDQRGEHGEFDAHNEVQVEFAAVFVAGSADADSKACGDADSEANAEGRGERGVCQTNSFASGQIN